MAKARSKSATPPPAPAPDQPYYLQKARLKDYRSVRDAEVEFKPGLNIIIGPNGSGKTNFIDATAYLIDTQSSRNNLLSTTGSFKLMGRHYVEVDYARSSDEQLLPDKDDNFFMDDPDAGLIQQIKVDGEDRTKGGLSLVALDGKTTYWAVVKISHGIPIDKLPLVANPFEAWISRTGYIERLDDSKRHSEVYSDFVSGIIYGINNSLQYHTLPLAIKRKKLESKEEVRQRVLDTIALHLERARDYLIRFSPVEDIRLDAAKFRIYGDAVDGRLFMKDLEFEYLVNGNWWTFKNLSDGTKRIIYVVTELASETIAFIGSDDKPAAMPFDKIILLEEPELGIHPHQLHLLLGLIREVSEKHQVIITTHSPQVLDMLKADELDRILICELLDPKKGTQFRRLTEAEQEHARRYMREVGFLSDYWRLEDLDGVVARSAQ